MNEQRVGDSERDAAVGSLREHTSAGRLTLEEFDERMTAALAARTQADLRMLFTDLPGGAPAGELVVPSARTKGLVSKKSGSAGLETTKVVAVTVVWLAFFAVVFLGVVPWWLFWIPLIVSEIITDDIGKKKGKPKKEPGS